MNEITPDAAFDLLLAYGDALRERSSLPARKRNENGQHSEEDIRNRDKYGRGVIHKLKVSIDKMACTISKQKEKGIYCK